ncbi:MAG: alpha/beta fold hydrolase [Myxococcaceae bacterium]
MDLLLTLHTVVRRALVARGVEASAREVGGHLVHFYRLPGRGTGAPVVLVHGLASNANAFARMLLGLASRFSCVYAMDLPGNGFSPLPQSGPLALEEYLDVLHAFCQQVVGEPALVVGNSLGGALALTLAVEHPEDVCALGLLAPAGARLPPERFAEMMQRLEVHTARQGLSFTRRLFHRAPVMALLLAPQMAKVHNTPAVRAIRTAATVEDHLSPEELARVEVPTLLLWGGSEKLLPAETLAYYRQHLPASARIEVVEAVGHVPQMERPREMVRRLVDFAEEAGLLGVNATSQPASAPSAGNGSTAAPSHA